MSKKIYFFLLFLGVIATPLSALAADVQLGATVSTSGIVSQLNGPNEAGTDRLRLARWNTYPSSAAAICNDAIPTTLPLDLDDYACGAGNLTFYLDWINGAGSIRGGYAMFTRTGGVWATDMPYVPPAATTDFNEVVDYIYDPVLNNSFGTSTVGATFSIPEPSFIDAIGVRLRGPLGNLLWSATSSPSVAGTYDISTDFYFDTSGAYELSAFFVQDGNEVANPVSVYIVVNAPVYVFDPITGNLVPEASTTIATSTLVAFNLDCPDDALVGSLCKLAVGLLIPKVSSIQGMQTSFYGLMGKAPFSFFTQSKTLLDAFRVGTLQTGGALTLNLYGNSIDVISTTTASSIGVDETTINFIKGIMVVALWLMLAWYLYWRIASIFGV